MNRFLLLSALIALCSSQTCYSPEYQNCKPEEGVPCYPGQHVCGTYCFDENYSVCYTENGKCDPNIQSCFSDDFTLCGLSYPSYCNGQCYSKYSHQCLTSTGAACPDPDFCTDPTAQVVPNGSYLCGEGNYNPNKQECFFADGSICPPNTHCPTAVSFCTYGYNLCGPKYCYSTDQKGDKCYLPSGEMCPERTSCTTEGSYICSYSSRTCGNRCYKPGLEWCFLSNGEKCMTSDYNCPDGVAVCDSKVPFEPCGDFCYMPSSGSTCYFENGQQCTGNCVAASYICDIPGEQPCGEDGCYSPDIYTCWHKNGQKCEGSCPEAARACFSDYRYCGVNCYDEQYHKCLTSLSTICDPSTNYNCENGVATCPLSYGFCGSECFNPETQYCLGNDGRQCTDSSCIVRDPVAMCNKEEGVCGTHCYDMKTETCYNKDGSVCTQQICTSGLVACAAGEKMCGETCFNPTTNQCYDSNGSPCLDSCPADSVGTCTYDQAMCYNPNAHAGAVETSSENSSSGPSSGEVIGLVVGIIALVGLLAGVIYWHTYKRVTVTGHSRLVSQEEENNELFVRS